MNRFRLIDEVSIYFLGSKKKVIYFVVYRLVFNRTLSMSRIPIFPYSLFFLKVTNPIHLMLWRDYFLLFLVWHLSKNWKCRNTLKIGKGSSINYVTQFQEIFCPFCNASMPLALCPSITLPPTPRSPELGWVNYGQPLRHSHDSQPFIASFQNQCLNGP